MKQNGKSAKVNKIDQQTPQQCCICSLNIQMKQKPEEQGMLMMKCKSCGLCAHSYCYGLSIQPQQQLKNGIYDIECDGCRVGKKNQTCMLCQKPGLLKKLSDQINKYVHVPCAVFSPQIQVMSFMSMNFATRIDAKRSRIHKCVSCGKSDASLMCLTCQTSIHPNCLVSDGQWSLSLKYGECCSTPVSWDAYKREINGVQQVFQNAFDDVKAVLKMEDSLIGLDEMQKQIRIAVEPYFNSLKKSIQPQKEKQQQSIPGSIITLCPNHRIPPIVGQCVECGESHSKRSSRNNDQCEGCLNLQQQKILISSLITKPQLVDLQKIQIPTNGFMDFIPLFIFFEQLCARFSCGEGEVLTKTSFAILQSYRAFLDASPVSPSMLIELELMQAKEDVGALIQENSVELWGIIMQSVRQLKQQSVYFQAVHKRLCSRGYSFPFIDQLLNISRENSLMMSVGSTPLPLRQVKKIIRGAQREGLIAPNTLYLVRQSARNQQLRDLEQFVLEKGTLKQCSLVHILGRYAQLESLKQTAIKLFEWVPQEFMEEEEENGTNESLEERLSQIQKYYDNLMQLQQSRPTIQKIEDVVNQMKNLQIETRFQLDLQVLIQDAKIAERSSSSLENVLSLPVTSQKLQAIVQKAMQRDTLEAKRNHIEELLVEEDEELELPSTELDLIFQLPNQSEALQAEYVRYQKAQKAIDALNSTEETIERAYEALQQVRILTGNFVRYRNQIAVYRGVKERLQQLCNESDLKECQAQLELSDSALLVSIEKRLTHLYQCKQLLVTLRPKQFTTEGIAKFEQLQQEMLSQKVSVDELTTLLSQAKHLEQLVMGVYELWFPNHHLDFDATFQAVLEYKFPQLPPHLLQQKTTRLTDLCSQHIPTLQGNHIILQKVKLILWRCQSDLIVQEANSDHPRISQFLLRQLIEQQSEHQSLEHRDISAFRELKRLFGELQQWLEQYRFLSRKDLSVALNTLAESPADYRQFQRQTMELLRRGTRSPIDLSIQMNALIGLQLQLVWVWKSQCLLRRNISQQALMSLDVYAKVLNIPEGTLLRKTTEDGLRLYSEMKQQLKEYTQQRQQWQGDREKYYGIIIKFTREIGNLKNFRYQLIYISHKPSYEEIKNISKTLAQLNYQSHETEHLQEDMENAELMARRFQEVVAGMGSKQETENTSFLKELRRMMLYSFLKVDGMASQVFYYLLKAGVRRALSTASPTLSVLQHKLEDLRILAALDWFLNDRLKFPQQQKDTILDQSSGKATLEYSAIITNFLLNEHFDWVYEAEKNLRVDLMALSLNQRLKAGWEQIQSQESDQSTDNERIMLRERHCVKFSELDEFMKSQFKNVKYLRKNELKWIKTQYEASQSLRKTFEEMVERLREFQIKLDIYALESLIDEYLDGEVQVFIEEMLSLMQYITMARTFWGEVLDHRELMRQPILDSQRNRSIQEFMLSLLQAQKKFNVEIPDVRRFFDEYTRTSVRLEEACSGRISDLGALKTYLNKDVPQHLRCLDLYSQSQVMVWVSEVNQLQYQVIWTHARLVQEIQEAYRLLEVIISKRYQTILYCLYNSIPSLTQPIESFTLTPLMEKLMHPLQMLEDLYSHIEETDLHNPYLIKIDISERGPNGFTPRKPFDDIISFAERVRHRNSLKSKPIIRKRAAQTIRVKKPMKAIIKHANKSTLYDQDQDEQNIVSDGQRQNKRGILINVLKKNVYFAKNQLEQRVRTLENEIFGQFYGRKSAYELEMGNLRMFFNGIQNNKILSKKIAIKELDLMCIKRYMKEFNTDNTITPKLVQVNYSQKKVVPQNITPKKQQQIFVDSIIQSKQINERQQINLSPQKKLKLPFDQILYNPDPEQPVETSDILSLGTLKLKSMQVLKPLLLTMDSQIVGLFPQNLFDELQVHVKATCPSAQVLDYVLGHRETLRAVRGWLYSTDLGEAKELAALAHNLRQQRNAIGARHHDNHVGISIMPVEYMTQRLHNMNTKWVLPVGFDQSYLDFTYQEVELLKPQLGFVLYVKDMSAYKAYQWEKLLKGGLRTQPYEYVSVKQVPQLNTVKLIENHKDVVVHEVIETHYTRIPKTPGYAEMQQSRPTYEPISDEEEEIISGQSHNYQGFHSDSTFNYDDKNFDSGLKSIILKEVPNILTLLKNDSRY